MGKLILIMGACLVAASGAAFGLHAYMDLQDNMYDTITSRGVIDGGELGRGCCQASPGIGSSGGFAAAGPVALFTTSPVSSETGTCCAKKGAVAGVSCRETADPYAACCDLSAANHGLEAIAGAAATVTKK